MNLALFDLDNTLLAGDSDHAWNQFLAEVGAVHPTCHAETNDRFYQEYVAGTLDIHEFCRFAFSPLAEHPRAQLEQWREQFIETLIRPMIAPGAQHLLARHREAGDELVIITATNQFVTQPIAEILDVDHLIATLAEEREDGEFTGELTGVPCFQEGKIERLRQYLADPGPRGHHHAGQLLQRLAQRHPAAGAGRPPGGRGSRPDPGRARPGAWLAGDLAARARRLGQLNRPAICSSR